MTFVSPRTGLVYVYVMRARQEEQSGVTVPFYFICLLHLANEKGLKLEGRDDLLDFSVARDSAEDGL